MITENSEPTRKLSTLVLLASWELTLVLWKDHSCPVQGVKLSPSWSKSLQLPGKAVRERHPSCPVCRGTAGKESQQPQCKAGREAAVRSCWEFSNQLKILAASRKGLVLSLGRYSEGIIPVLGKLRCRRALWREWLNDLEQIQASQVPSLPAPTLH